MKFPQSITILLGFCFSFSGVAHGQGSGPATGLRAWKDYEVIMWVGDSVWKKPEKLPVFLERLKEMGVTAAMTHGDADPKPWVEAGFPYYVENVINKGLCLKWNSPVTDWNAFVTKWAKSGRPDSDLVRPYSLDDPEWQQWGRKRMGEFAVRHKPHQPLLADIRDELSTTISANPFDYDFSPATLSAFRSWLQTQYPSLAALNAGWDTSFATWESVMPFTTDRIKNRMASGEALPRGNPDWQAVQALKFVPAAARARAVGWNFAPWADFRTYMDISLARELQALREAWHAVDPATPVGIEGTQMPHPFGGYDLWRLSQAIDWVEPYDIANAREILGSFMPGGRFLTTVGEQKAREAQRRLWHLRLLGDSGCIIWWSEDCIDWSREEWPLTPRASGLAPVLKAMRSPLARLFTKARRQLDPVFIHYSQASIQAAWLMESTEDGSTWLRRFSSYESSHSRHARVREGWVKALEDMGYSPQFTAGPISALPDGATVILPDSWALSDADLAALRSRPAGTVLGSGCAGVFDERGRLRRSPGLAEPASQDAVWSLTGAGAVPVTGIAAAYGKARLQPVPAGDWTDALRSIIRPGAAVAVSAADRIRVHRYSMSGKASLLAIERNVSYQMSEDLSQGGGNEALEKEISVRGVLPAPLWLYDLRSGKSMGHSKEFTITVDPWQPSLIAGFAAALPEGADPVAFLARSGE